MGIRLTWAPNTESDIASYEIERSSDGITFTALATVIHDLNDPLVYDSTEGVFFYLDSTGVANQDFYRIRAVDTGGNKSSYSTPKQVGPPNPDICVVYGTIVDADGNPNTDVQVRATIISTEESQDGQIVGQFGVTNNPIVETTDDNGFFELLLIQGAEVTLHIPVINLRRVVTIPAQATADFQSLL